MQVLLLDNIDRLGNLGDVCDVKPGYARNYLFPQGKALVASEESQRLFETRRVELEQQLQTQQAATKSLAEKASTLELKFERRASEVGKLYGFGEHR